MENWIIYLSGEIHSDWRDQIKDGCLAKNLPVIIVGPVTNHEASDDCGVEILGQEDNPFWKDHKSAQVNAIRTRTLIAKSDIVVIKFGDKFRQWNAAFDAGIAATLGKPIIVLHAKDLTHALKEIDAAALAVTEKPTQVVQVLDYAINENL
ncbi:MAG TPA: YtoQ family protein [Rhodospirillales bacterium]|jgi:YtoQ family protein|nr:YtoQ family protein [Rhodospirillales bacterium]